MNARLLRTVIAGALAVTAANLATAQSLDSGRSTGVFLHDTTPAGTKTLGVGLTVSGAYETNAEAERMPSPSLFDITGWHQDLEATTVYRFGGKRLTLGLSGGTMLRYYPASEGVVRMGDSVGAGFVLRPQQRTSLVANYATICAPLQFGSVFPSIEPATPGVVPEAAYRFALDEDRACTHDVSASLTRELGRRLSLEAVSSYRYIALDEDQGYEPLHNYSIGARVIRRVSRDGNLHLGYTRRVADYSTRLVTRQRSVLHDLDVGLDADRALSLTRRTYIGFSTGSTFGHQPRANGTLEPEFRITGSVALNREISRTWRATLTFNRSVLFVDGIAAPVLTNGLFGSAAGSVNRRIDLGASYGLSVGHVATAGGQPYRSYIASARARYGLSPRWALQAEYHFYLADADAVSSLLYAVSPTTRRNTVRVGLTTWLPLVKR